MKPLFSIPLAALLCIPANGQEKTPASKGDSAQRELAALRAIRKALIDLPAGQERDDVQAALARLAKKVAQTLNDRIALELSNVDMLRDRASWSQRMALRRFVSEAQAQADQVRLQAAELALQRLRNELRDVELEKQK